MLSCPGPPRLLPFTKLKLSPQFYEQPGPPLLSLARGWLEVPVGPVPVLWLFTKVLLLTSHKGEVRSSVCWMSSTVGPAQGRCLPIQTHQMSQLLSGRPSKPGVHLTDAFLPGTGAAASPFPAIPLATGQGPNLFHQCPQPFHRAVHCVFSANTMPSPK